MVQSWFKPNRAGLVCKGLPGVEKNFQLSLFCILQCPGFALLLRCNTGDEMMTSRPRIDDTQTFKAFKLNGAANSATRKACRRLWANPYYCRHLSDEDRADRIIANVVWDASEATR